MSEFRARLLATIAITASFTSVVIGQTPNQQALGNCTGSGCAAVSKAELFIKTFATAGNSKGLRTSQLEQEEQVRLAFYGMDATRMEIEAGRLTEQEGNFIIDGHEQVIRDFIQDKSNEARVSAAAGQASDIPAISKSLSGLLGVARQDALMGREELAQQAQAQMVRVLATFSQAFADTCQQQSFPVETALALERQNELMGTDISLTHCINRKFSAEMTSQGVNYRFETCSNLSGFTAWKLKISGRVVGEGKGQENLWEAKTVFRGWKAEPWGEMEVFSEEIEEKEESIRIPNDAGSNSKPNGWASAPIPTPTQRPKKVQVLKMRIRTILLMGERGFDGNDAGPWVEGEIKREDKPCNPVTEATFS